MRLPDIEGDERVPGSSRSETRFLHRVEVDRVGALAVVVAPVGEAGARSTVVVEGLAETDRRPASAATPRRSFPEEDPLGREVDGDPFEHQTATAADERERGRRAQVVQGVLSHRHWAETVANTAPSAGDGRQMRAARATSGRRCDG
jgi:hypothetical protein